MRINELLEEKQPEFREILRDFFPLAKKIIGLDSVPTIKFVKRVADKQQPTFGKFINDQGVIYLGIENRHPLDILRTLAHELVHYKQGVEHQLDATSGHTGSPAENQAHEVAGIVMRHFNKTYPKYFSALPVNLEEGKWNDFKKEFVRKGKQSLATAAAIGAFSGGVAGYDYAKHKFQHPPTYQQQQQQQPQKLIPSDDNDDFYKSMPPDETVPDIDVNPPKKELPVQAPLSPEYFKKYVETQKNTVFKDPTENALKNAAMKAGIVGLELDQFLGQCAHESIQFTEYDEAKRNGHWRMGTETLTKAWFLANRHYWKYRGRGPIQITLESQYKAIGEYLGIDLDHHPELALSQKYMIPIAIAYWKINVQKRVPKDQMWDTGKVTKVINPRGSREALEKRHLLVQQFTNWFKDKVKRSEGKGS